MADGPRRLDDPDPETCGSAAGTGAGVYLHRRARERLCDPCGAYERTDQNRRYRENADHATNRRRYARARQRALNDLARRHRAEFNALLRRHLAAQWETR